MITKPQTTFNMTVKRCATDSYIDELRCMMFACVRNKCFVIEALFMGKTRVRA